MDTEPLVRNISDTARWAAYFRGIESDRPDAVFRDPHAYQLAGDRGRQIAAAMPDSTKFAWTWTTRTYLFDQFISEQIHQGVDCVVNLAAGLDARPYRMNLPASLRWFEIDMPELLSYKQEILASATPRCRLERIPQDLTDIPARREVFDRISRDCKKALILTEGLIIYLTEPQVTSLAQDLAAPRAFQRWVTDLASPGLVQMLQRQMGKNLSQGNAQLQFGPKEGPPFFTPTGWRPTDIRNLLKSAGKLKRLPLFLRIISLLPASNTKQGSRPWSAICLFTRTSST
jgi:methyltransferase (TIGR00027 family)